MVAGQVLLVGTSLPFVGNLAAFHNLMVEETEELYRVENFPAIQGVVFHHTTSMNDVDLGDPYMTLCVSSMLRVHCSELNMLCIVLRLSLFLWVSDL